MQYGFSRTWHESVSKYNIEKLAASGNNKVEEWDRNMAPNHDIVIFSVSDASNLNCCMSKLCVNMKS